MTQLTADLLISTELYRQARDPAGLLMAAVDDLLASSPGADVIMLRVLQFCPPDDR